MERLPESFEDRNARHQSERDLYSNRANLIELVDTRGLYKSKDRDSLTGGIPSSPRSISPVVGNYRERHEEGPDTFVDFSVSTDAEGNQIYVNDKGEDITKEVKNHYPG
jgi:hypothetical protein